MKKKDTLSLSGLKNVAHEVARRIDIFPEGGRGVLLHGEMGAGKTTFARYFGEYFGQMLSSPTFSLLSYYDLPNGKVLVHADFHRIDNHRFEEVFEEIEPLLSDEKYVFLFEWFPKEYRDEYLKSFAYLEIFLCHIDNEDQRGFTFDFSNPWSASLQTSKDLIREYKTPVHVQHHIEKVRQVSLFCADRLIDSGYIVDKELVEVGAMLHDGVRYVDFPSFEPSDFARYQEKVTTEKLNFWVELRKKYLKMHHAQAMAEILTARSFIATARVVDAHNTGQIFREMPFSWEEKCVYYADKRALHDTIVSLQGRLEDGKKRYAHEASPQLDKKIYEMESELCKAGSFDPAEITAELLDKRYKKSLPILEG